MKGFMLSDGDLVITNNEIVMTQGNELISQTIQCVLSTNKGEWIFDEEEGIDFDNIFGKQRVKTKTTKATDAFYRDELLNAREDDNALAEKLLRRLDGE